MESLKSVCPETLVWENEKDSNEMDTQSRNQKSDMIKSTITVDSTKISTPVRGRGRSEELKVQNRNEGKIHVPQRGYNQNTNTMPRRPKNDHGLHTKIHQGDGQRNTYGNFYPETKRCFNCQKTGHYKRDCWHQLRENGKNDKDDQIKEALEKRNFEIVRYTNRLRNAHEIIKMKTQEFDEILKELTISCFQSEK